MAAQYLALDGFWIDQSNYAEAEQKFYERLGHETLTPLVAEFVKARETIKEMKRQANEATDIFGDGITVNDNKSINSWETSKTIIEGNKCAVEETSSNEISAEKNEIRTVLDKTERNENVPLKNVGGNISNMDYESIKFLEKKMLAFTDGLAKVQSQLEAMETRLSIIEKRTPMVAICPAKPLPPASAKSGVGDDDDVDLFGSDSEDDETAARVKEERLAAYNAKKSKKPAVIAKSSIVLDVKPWDDETDMKAMEEVVRKIECDGLLWGASKLVPLAYGIKKLQITCVVVDDKVSIDWLQEQIESKEDYIQSVDIAAFNKI